MDVKEIIKWLSQASKTKNKNNLKYNSCCVFLVVFVTLNFFTFCVALDSEKNAPVINELKIPKKLLLSEGGGQEILTLNKTKKFSDVHSLNFKCFKNLSGMELVYVKKYVKFLRTANDVIDGLLHKGVGEESARTFGRPIRKLQQMMLPVMFKLGVMSTLIVLTFLLVLKVVVLLKMLLIFKAASVLSKIGWVDHGHHHQSGPGWQPNKEVHLHIHNGGSGYGGGISGSPFPSAPSEPGWQRQDLFPAASQPQQVAAYGYGATAAGGGPVSINTPYGHYVRTGGPTAPTRR